MCILLITEGVLKEDREQNQDQEKGQILEQVEEDSLHQC